MAERTIAAIDLGTTSCRAELFSLQGEPLARHSIEYSVDTSTPEAAEQNAEGWWKAVCECLRAVVKAAGVNGEDVQAIGISAQGHSWVPVDDAFNPLRPAFTWLDRRSQRYAAQLLKELGPQTWGEVAGKTPGPWHMLPQLLWLRDHEPEIASKASHLLFAHDFLVAKFTSHPVTDYTTAAGSLFFDINRCQWATEILGGYGISPRLLPRAVASGTVIGRLTPEAAKQTGLGTRTVVCAGAQDQKCAAFGAGIAPGVATASLGTSTAIEALVAKPVFHHEMPIPCFPFLTRNAWVLEAALSTTGGAINSLRNALRTVAPDLTYDELTDIAATAPAGSGGVLYFPFPAGAGTPHMRFDASAAFVGISLSTGLAEMARAMFEGTAFEIATAITAMHDAGCNIEQLCLFGGGVRSVPWVEMIAAVVGIPCYTCDEAETASRGAAMLAAEGLLQKDETRMLQAKLRSKAQRVTVTNHMWDDYQDLYRRYLRARKVYWPFIDSLNRGKSE